jgi:hypothetical protein
MPLPDDRDGKASLSPRATRAARSAPRSANVAIAVQARPRRGTMNILLSEWRRCEMGSNHIACYGVWRTGARRQPGRPNRYGETRWHMPHRMPVASTH